MSSGSPVSAGGSNSSSSDNPEPPPQPKKYCCVAAHSPVDRVVDVDVMSSDGCHVHMLSEREYGIHKSNEDNMHSFSFCIFLCDVRDLGRQMDILPCMEHCRKNAWKFTNSFGKMLGIFGSQTGL